MCDPPFSPTNLTRVWPQSHIASVCVHRGSRSPALDSAVAIAARLLVSARTLHRTAKASDKKLESKSLMLKTDDGTSNPNP